MRTTLDLPDELFREAKVSAARRGIALKALFTQALAREVQAPGKEGAVRHRVRLPLVKSKRPGTLQLTNAQIEKLLD
ncbi:MAG: hypothetical protein NTW87_26365 [Planctomycetota bacterium]|nr:hypothetical protein [Planctomycetota bacterium]